MHQEVVGLVFCQKRNNIFNISDKLLASPSKFLWRLAQETKISLGSTHTAIKKNLIYIHTKYNLFHVNNLKPTCHIKMVHKVLNHYCHCGSSQWFQNFVAEWGIEVLDECFYTDEAWLHLSGYLNSQNTMLWSIENPHKSWAYSTFQKNIDTCTVHYIIPDSWRI